jgi:FAD:protein FMN transferase
VWKRITSATFCLTALHGAQQPERIEAAEPIMGTLFRMTVYSTDPVVARSVLNQAFERVRTLDAMLSDYKPDSELMRACRTAHKQPVPVSEDLFLLLEAAQNLARQTEGAFDVTLGPVIQLWRKSRKEGQLPAPAELQQARRHSGYQHLTLDAKHRTMSLDLSDMQIDLGGIAKGYAADEALHVLQSRGLRQALVAAGGDLAIGDPPPGQSGWRVGLELPDTAAKDHFTEVVTLHNTAVSTSGDTEQFVEIGGARYSHIIDPATGIALRESIGATVIAKRGMDADALATAICVMGADRGLQFIEQQTSAAVMIVTPHRRHISRRFPIPDQRK